MKKYFLLFFAVMLCAIGARAWTVKFTNPENWSEVAVWAWDNSQNYTGGVWPGKKMTKAGDVWTYTGEGNPVNIIFNNNGNGAQTGNLDFVDGATYNMTGVVSNGGGGGDDPIVEHTPIYISYNFGAGSASNWQMDAIEMNYADGVYTATVTNTGDTGWMTFGIGGKLGSGWNSNYRYGPQNDNELLTNSTAGHRIIKTNTCFTVAVGTYNVTVKQENGSWMVYFVTSGGGGGDDPDPSLCDNRKDGMSPTGTLPVIYINTAEIMIDRNLRDKDYRDATYYLVDNANPNNNIGSEAEPLPLTIKARGNYTRTGFSKKPYKLKLNAKQGMLGLTKSKHFALLAHADEEHGYLNNTVGFWLGNEIGLPWTPREIPVEVVINGDYRGLYFLTESIRVGDNRIKIEELNDNETDPALCSGGYLVEMDNYSEEGQIVVGGYNGRKFTPDTPEELSELQRRFLTEQLTKMDNLVYQHSNDLWKYLDLDDAAKYYVVMEIIDHWEAYHGSTYIFRNRGNGEKWHFSPLWDCGHAFDFTNAAHYFTDAPADSYGNDWIGDLRQNGKFMEKVKAYWQWFWSTGRYDALKAMINDFTNTIAEAARHDHDRWGDVATPDQYNDPMNGNYPTNPTPVRDNSNISAKKANVLAALDSKVNFLVGKWGDYHNDNPEPERDTTPAAELPSYVDPDYVTPIYISHDFSGGTGWNNNHDQMQYADGVYTATITNDAATGYFYFSIGGTSNGWGGEYQYGPQTEGPANCGEDNGNILYRVNTCFTLAKGVYDVTVKLVDGKYVAYLVKQPEPVDPSDTKPGMTPTGTLPVLYITTSDEMLSRNLQDKNYRDGSYYLVDNDNPANNLGSEDAPLPLEIKARGNYTRTGFSKKPYKLKLGKKQGMLGMTKSKHFALLAHADEGHGFYNNTIGFWLGKEIGLPWTPRETPIEVVINGDYRGIYFLTESIRVGDDRVPITELDDDVTDPALCSGGYLVEMDNYADDNQIVVGGTYGRKITPDTPESLSSIQRRFLTDQFTEIDKLVSQHSNDLWSYLDLDDAARYYVVMEIIDHWEAYHGSTYLYRDFGHGQKWHFSPLWDCGHAFDFTNAAHYFTEAPTSQLGLQHYGNDWIGDLRQNGKFMDKVKATWQWFWSNDGYNRLLTMMSEFKDKVSAAAAHDAERWGNAPLPAQYDDPLNGNYPTNPTAVVNNSDMNAKYTHVKKALDSKINYLKGLWGDYNNDNPEPERDNTAPAPLPSYVDPDFEPVYYTVYFMFEDQNIDQMRLWIWNNDLGGETVLGVADWNARPTLNVQTAYDGTRYFEYSILGNDFDLTLNPSIKFGGGSDGSYKETLQQFVPGQLYKVKNNGALETIPNWSVPQPPYSGTLGVLTITVNDGADITDTTTKHAAVATLKDADGAFTDKDLTITGRGTSTWNDFDKKPYKLKFDKKQTPCGIALSKHFVLLPYAADTELSYLRNIAGHALSKQLGLDWTPAIEPVELILNNEYLGLYFIVENIRPAATRVTIEDIGDYDATTMPEIWGDYIVELDMTAETPDFSFGEYDPADPQTAATSAKFVLDSPEMADLTRDSDKEWIANSLGELFNAMTGTANSIENNFHTVIDRESFIKYYLVQEIMDDANAFNKSMYIHRSGVDGLWKFGPVWDFSGAFDHKDQKGHLLTDLTEQPDGHSHALPLVSNFLKNIMVFNEVAVAFRTFAGTLIESEISGIPRWPAIEATAAPRRAPRDGAASIDNVYSEIDAAAAKYKTALDYDQARWSDNPGTANVDDSVDKVKSYLDSNMAYLNNAFATLIPSGIETVMATSADNFPVEYYDLTGRRVLTPVNGFYIRRQGPIAIKIFIP
ncbi:MAG: CotH kinase family protein [Muribaculaceae bacterium]|nr:CotH kinase family protein [Muribaculaceae bacterium]